MEVFPSYIYIFRVFCLFLTEVAFISVGLKQNLQINPKKFFEIRTKSILVGHPLRALECCVRTQLKVVCAPSLPLVFCVHGNKWGMAECCEELKGEDSTVHCHQVRAERTYNLCRGGLGVLSIPGVSYLFLIKDLQ